MQNKLKNSEETGIRAVEYTRKFAAVPFMCPSFAPWWRGERFLFCGPAWTSHAG